VNQQRANIERVSDAIAVFVTKFLREHLNEEFHVETLREYVYQNVGGYVAPASPDRRSTGNRRCFKLCRETSFGGSQP
jgi:hypothetical protein